MSEESREKQSASPSDPDENVGGAEGGQAEEADRDSKRQKIQSGGPGPFFVQPSPPKFVSFTDLMEAANGVRNMSLAHEIAVDANFKLERLEPPTSSIQKQVKEVMHKAFWDSFSEKVNEDPPDFRQAVVLISEVKESLLSLLLPQHIRFKSQLEEILDAELIQQKMENDAFDIYYYSNYVLSVMAKLCSPARDERIEKAKSIKDVVPLFKEIFEVLDLMKMDMANFTIQQIRPYIQQQSVEYERKKFEDFLEKQKESGIDGLELTKLWLDRSYMNLQSGQHPQTEGATGQSKLTPASILNCAYMELLHWDDGRLLPETLVMDKSRFMDLRDKTQRIILVTSVLLVTYNTVGQSIADVQDLKVKLKNEICSILDGSEEKDQTVTMEHVAEQVNKNVEEFLKSHDFKEREPAQQNILKNQIKELASTDHPVSKIMSKRLFNFIQQAIFSKHTEPLKVPVGMSVMESELSQICGEFLRLISHNRSVFGLKYADIIGAMIERQQSDLSPREETPGSSSAV